MSGLISNICNTLSDFSNTMRLGFNTTPTPDRIIYATPLLMLGGIIWYQNLPNEPYFGKILLLGAQVIITNCTLKIMYYTGKSAEHRRTIAAALAALAPLAAPTHPQLNIHHGRRAIGTRQCTTRSAV